MTPQRPVRNVPEGVHTAKGWRAVLAGLARDEGELDGELDAVRTERRPIARDVYAGVPAAVAQNAKLNERQVAALNRMDLLLVARGTVQEKLAEAEAAEAAAVAAARLQRLRQGAEAAERAAAVVDAAAGRLSEAFGAYRVAVSGLIPDGLDSGRISKLRNRVKLLGAMHAAGLADHLVLDRVPASHQETMESWTRRMLRDLLPEPAVAPGAPEPVEPAEAEGVPA